MLNISNMIHLAFEECLFVHLLIIIAFYYIIIFFALHNENYKALSMQVSWKVFKYHFKRHIIGWYTVMSYTWDIGLQWYFWYKYCTPSDTIFALSLALWKSFIFSYNIIPIGSQKPDVSNTPRNKNTCVNILKYI